MAEQENGVNRETSWQLWERYLQLTPQQRKVANQVCSGKTNRAIAEEFGLSEKTVKTHLRNVFDELGVDSRLQLAVLLTQLNLEQNLEMAA